MNGHNVFFPIGFDAFGLPAENAAIKSGVHPAEWTMRNIENMRRQLRSMGATFDWDERGRHLPARLLPLEPVVLPALPRGRPGLPPDGRRRLVPQGPGRAGARAGRGPRPGLLALRHARSSSATSSSGSSASRSTRTSCSTSRASTGPSRSGSMQTNWIGRSEGAEVVFRTAPSDHHAGGEELRVFTTRPDTLFGATFMVLAPEHPLVARADRARRSARTVEALRRADPPARREIERLSTDREKTGVPIGADAINPVNGERIPIWIADYVLAGYGTGAIMAVPAPRRARLRVRAAVRPAHPARDRRPATMPDDAPLPRRYVIARRRPTRLVNSGRYTRPARGPRASRRIVADLEARGEGSAAVTYRIRDWLVSRQRAWGTPIPVVYCEGSRHAASCRCRTTSCRSLLPEDFQYRPRAATRSRRPSRSCARPARAAAAQARRETDTMDTFVDSSWYWWRYLSPAARRRRDRRRPRGDAGARSTSTRAAPSTR